MLMFGTDLAPRIQDVLIISRGLGVRQVPSVGIILLNGTK